VNESIWIRIEDTGLYRMSIREGSVSGRVRYNLPNSVSLVQIDRRLKSEVLA
jgi:hypothetical protein